MGFFDKKYCDICGEKIGLLGNRKLEDGNCCKDCAKKLSPWFSERRESTVNEIKEQLADREANKEKVRMFQITRDLQGASSYHVFIDDTKGQFAVAYSMDEDTNPDILDVSSVTGCRLDINEDREEQEYRNEDGEMVSYTPPMYKYSYNYRIIITLNHPWISEIKFNLNNFSIEDRERNKMMEMENQGNQIVAALTGQPAGAMPNGMYHQPMNGMPNGMYHQPMNGMQGGMYNQQMNNMQGGMQQNRAGGSWICTNCGTANTGKFCAGCGQPQPMTNMGSTRASMVRCDKCGWTSPDPSNAPKFCPNCGDPINLNDIL